MDQYPRSLDMFEKRIAQSHSLVCAFDQSGDIRQDQICFCVQAGNAQVGFNGGKWIIRNAGFRVGYRCQKAGFARIRNAYNSDIREQF